MKLARKYRNLGGDGLQVSLELTFCNLGKFKDFIRRFKPADFPGVSVAVICIDKCQQCDAEANSSLSGDKLMLFAHRARQRKKTGRGLISDLLNRFLIAIRIREQAGSEFFYHLCPTCELHHYGSFGQVCLQEDAAQKEIALLKKQPA